MDFFRKLFGGSQQKDFNSAIFQFFSPKDMPRMGEKQYLLAYKSWVFACTNAIAKRVADIELKLQQKTSTAWKDIHDHPSLDLLRKVNDFQTFYDLVYATQSYLELDGNAFWYVPRNGNQAPSEIWYLDPTRVTIAKSEKDYISGYVFQNYQGSQVAMDADEVIHFKRFHPINQYRGMGTVEAAALSIDIDTYAAEWQRNFFGNSAMPSGILYSDGTLSQEQYDRIKANWDSKFKGVSNAHKLGVLEGGLKYQSLTPTSREMQFAESRKNIRDEILGIFQVPKPILGILEDVNLASAQVAEYIFAKDRIRPEMKFFIGKLTEFYLPLFNVDTDKFRLWFTDPVPENTEQKLAIILNGRQNGWMTANEARAQFNYPKREDGDVLNQSNFNPPLPGTDAPDDPEHEAQDEEEADEQENDNGKSVKKNIIRKEVKKKAEAYKAEQIEALTKSFNEINGQIKKQLLDNLEKHKSVEINDGSYLSELVPIVKKDTATELLAILFDGYEKWGDAIYATSYAAMKKIMEKGGADGMAEVNVDASFSVDNPRATAWLEQHALEDSTSYPQTIKDQISQRVTDGVDQGLSRDQIANNIGEFFNETDQYRAERIARTETISAYSQSNLESYRQSGVVSGKEWVYDDGNCTSGECPDNAAEGSIPLDDDFSSGDDAPPSHPNCLLRDAKIQTDKDVKNIEDIQVGDKVLTHKGRFKPVVALSKRKYEGELVTLSTNGIEISATPDHPFLTQDGWKYSKDIQYSDSLFFLDELNLFSKIKGISKKQKSFKGYVYNFEVEEDHSYVANGIISSNCECDIQPVINEGDSEE